MLKVINISRHNVICGYFLRAFILQAVFKIRKFAPRNRVTDSLMTCSRHPKDQAQLFQHESPVLIRIAFTENVEDIGQGMKSNVALHIIAGTGLQDRLCALIKRLPYRQKVQCNICVNQNDHISHPSHLPILSCSPALV